MKKYWYGVIVIIVFLIIIGIKNMNQVTSDLLSKLPEKIGVWGVSAPDQIFDQQTLYEYIDGGAELYLSYGLKKAYNRTFSAPGQPDLIIDIFEMGTSENAFGVFSQSREVIDTTFGQGSQYTAGLLQFWKDRYYVSILASPETEESRAAVFELANKVESLIKKNGKLPPILKYLPQDSLIEASVRYFRHYIWLNSHYFISNENIFFIDKNSEAVLAKYSVRESLPVLLLVFYKDPSVAEKAKINFATQYLQTKEGEEIVLHENQKWVGYHVENNFFVAIFNGSNREDVLFLLNAVEKKIINQ